jgi:hypothetical protein
MGAQGHDGLTRVDGEPSLEIQGRIGTVHLIELVPDGQGCPDRPLGIVPVGAGRAEYPHDVQKAIPG